MNCFKNFDNFKGCYYIEFSDGNLARRAFKDPDFFSAATDVPAWIITDLWNLYVALASPLPLDPVKIRTFTLDFKKRYKQIIDWHPIPPAVGSVVDHFHEVIEVFPPTIRSGMLR